MIPLTILNTIDRGSFYLAVPVAMNFIHIYYHALELATFLSFLETFMP